MGLFIPDPPKPKGKRGKKGSKKDVMVGHKRMHKGQIFGIEWK